MLTNIPLLSVISNTMSLGPVIVGAVVSTTVTNCVSDIEFPEVSVAVHVTIVSPSGNTSGASFITNDISTASETLTPISSIKFSVEFTASIFISDGATTSGAIVSITLTSCTLDTTFSKLSDAIHVTTVSPSEKVSGASFDT